jgi:HAD superfamily hydrolase (TIGR01509 family)
MVEGIIFDLDGVLINSSVCHRDAFQAVLAPYGIHDFDYPTYAGKRTPDVIAEVFHRAGIAADPKMIAQTAQEKSRLARQLLGEKEPLADGCTEILKQLAARYSLALATSGSRPSLEMFLDLTGCRPLFRSILSGEDVVQAKPDPEIYRRSAEALRIPSTHCLVVEDAVAGVEAARASGATVVGVAGTCPPDVLQEAGAAYIIRKLPELPDLVASL